MTRDEQVVRVCTAAGLLCTGAVVLGAFLPWMALTNAYGTTEVAGFETAMTNLQAGTVHGEQQFLSDGFFFAIEAAIVATLLALTWLGYKRVLFFSLSLLLVPIILGFSITNVVDTSTLLGDLESSGVATGRVGQGLWLTVAASASLEAALVGALAGTFVQRKRHGRVAGIASEATGTPGAGGTDEPPSVPIEGASG